jgi:hypothetical protein
MSKRDMTTAEWHRMREANTKKIKTLWKELEELQKTYSDCGAWDSDVDRKLQGMLYAMGLEVPVAVPSTPCAYLLLIEVNEERSRECAREFYRVLSKMKKLWKTFDGPPMPRDLYAFMKQKCRRVVGHD